MEHDTAFVFPGQGSQSIGMLGDVARIYSAVHETFVEASDVLGYDLWQLTQDGPIERLNQTEFTQPALLTAGVALWRCWQSRCTRLPRAMAGHSLGEYSALVCAESIDFAVAVRLVAARARIMANAVPAGTGAMLAILGLADDVLESVCAEAGQGAVVQCSNYNAPGQIVLGGDRAAVARAAELAKARGARKIIEVAMSVPSHCLLMKDAADELSGVLESTPIRTPAVRVLHNFDCQSYDEPALIRNALRKQLFHPVRWVDLVRTLHRAGITIQVECGPGKVLTGLAKRIEPTLRCLSIADACSLDTTYAELLNGR
ncbi:MAG: ACP S-malonyltransferase [Gammaproteobacteria bacterium]|nr:ACP S-malonyltransferase [Gammaproteobacteria bacterium]